MNRQPRVTILLSTYNGATFLEELLDSVFAQDYPNFSLRVRDDGSVDRTTHILARYAGRHQTMDVVYGGNVGVNQSFFSLLIDAPDSEYFAFCDQDDVWLPDKLSRAISMLRNRDPSKPLLYGSKVLPVNSDLRPIRPIGAPYRPARIENVLLQNLTPGCTMVLNQAARRIVTKEFPATVRMYDWWILQVVTAIGDVVLDPESRIYYRQHTNNTVGSPSSNAVKWIRRVRRNLARDKSDASYIALHARELIRIFQNEMSEDSIEPIHSLLDSRSSMNRRLRYFLTGEAARQTGFETLLFKTLFLFGRI